MVRPYLSLLIPELASVGQPLSGEYALRRSALEQLAFFSGYGVEIGLLVDFFSRFGAERFAEVDMDLRLHRNRPVSDLGKAAFGVLQALLLRTHRKEILTLHADLHTDLLVANGPVWEKHGMCERELPPVAGYRGKEWVNV
jgi:glucosyl-3-phosphoglycerate synthase